MELADRVRDRAERLLAHHEAGHAVAAVVRGGELHEVYLGAVDWTRWDEDALASDEGAYTRHTTRRVHRPFVTFAGPWASARWMVDNDPEVTEWDEALEYAWGDSLEDAEKYNTVTAELHQAAEELGLTPLSPAWEFAWERELDDLWPAVCEVAALLLNGERVTHSQVADAVERLS